MKRRHRSPARPDVAEPEGPSTVDLEVLRMFDKDAEDYVRIAAEEGLKVKYASRVGMFRGRNKAWDQPVTPDMIISGYIDHVLKLKGRESWFWWKHLLNIVHLIMRASPRWYGVADPLTSRYCSKCRNVKGLDEFPSEHATRCKECEGRLDARLRVPV